jgi:hypothetical protein
LSHLRAKVSILGGKNIVSEALVVNSATKRFSVLISFAKKYALL